MMRAGYIQLVNQKFHPAGNPVAVLLDWRPKFHESQSMSVDVYFREKRISLVSGRGLHKVGLFNHHHELDMVIWGQFAVANGGTMDIICEHFDPDRGLWTTSDKTVETSVRALEIMKHSGLD